MKNPVIEIFRAGAHKDSAGVEHAFTEADLDKIVAGYKPGEHEAPVVIGHPRENAPAFGWVASVARKGQRLFAEIKDMVPEFMDAWKKGMYKKRSISLYPDGTLRHVGFLGAVPPAVKGLADYQFADGDAVSFEFMEADDASNFRAIGRLFAAVRDWIIESSGKDKADQVLPTWEIDGLKTAETPAEVAPAYSERKPAIINLSEGASMATTQELEANVSTLTKANADLTAENATLKTQNASFSEAIKAKDGEIAGLKNKASAQEAAARKTEHVAFCEALVKEGKLFPKMKEAIVTQLELAHQASTGNFAEGQEKPIDALKKALTESPVVHEFAELAKKSNTSQPAGGSGSAAERIDRLITDKMKAKPDQRYSVAFSEVQKENPDLAKEYQIEVQGRSE